MTHHSQFGRASKPGREFTSEACSGPVRVSYFDPATGKPCKSRPRARSKQARASGFTAMKPSRVAVTVDGREYESMKMAALALGVSTSTMTRARREGWTELNGKPIAFAERSA